MISHPTDADREAQWEFQRLWDNPVVTPDVEQPQESFNRYASGTYLDNEWWGDLRTWNDSGEALEWVGW